MIPVHRLQTAATAEPIDTLGVVLLVAFVLTVTLMAIVLLRPSWTLPADSSESTDREKDAAFEPQLERSGELDWRRDALSSRPTGEMGAAPPIHMPAKPADQHAGHLPVWLAETGAAQTLAAFGAVSLVVSDLVDAARRGDLAAGFALYSPGFRERFRSGAGLDPVAFADWINSGVAPPDQPVRVRSISEVVARPDGRVEATVSYEPTDKPRPAERFMFIQDPGGGWLIDDITTIAP